jgi:hypothetical protein
MGGNGRISNLLQVIERAVEPNVNLLVTGIDRASGRHGILPHESLKDVARSDTQSGNPFVRELDEDSLGTFAEDVYFFDSRNV